MKFLSYKLKLLLILLIMLYRARGVTLYVEKGTCSQATCDGSLKDPFQDIGSALDSIEKNKTLSFDDELQLVIKDKIAEIEQGRGAEFFASVSLLKIKIQTTDSDSRVRIIMGEERFLSLQIHGGSLTFQNIDFEGNSVDKSVPYDFQAMEAGTDSFSPGFIKMSSKSGTLLTFKNCSFVGKFLRANKVDIFSSLIYLKNSDWNSAQVSIELDGVSVENCHYPRGLIYTDSPVFSYTRKTRILISNTNITKYTNKKLRHWSGGISMSAKKKDYSDFMIIVNNTYLELINCNIQDSSRIVVAIINNFLELRNISLSNNDNDLEKSPPEFIYLIIENSLRMTNIRFINLTIHTFDDQDDPSKRDFPFVDIYKDYAPSTLLNFEKNQALIAMGYHNGAVIIDVRFEYLTIFKAEHFISAIINLEYLNHFEAENLIFIKVELESNCVFGILGVFYAALQNSMYLRNVQIKNYYNFAFASSHFVIQLVKNSLEVKDFNINKVFFVMKATRDDLENFLSSMFLHLNEIIFLKSEVFKGGQLFAGWILNNFIIENVILNNTDCYSGCLLEFGFTNEITIKNVIVDFIYALRNGAMAMSVSNELKAANLTVTNSRSNIGVMYMQFNNKITIENSNFLENWGIGKFTYGRDAITGGISVDGFNQIVLRNCNFYKGVGDTRAGAFMAQRQNEISFFGINFIENEAITSDSLGGCIHVSMLNTLNFNGSKFLRNSGTFGGVVFAYIGNTIILQNCILENNKGQYGSIFFLKWENTVKMKSTNLTENQGFVTGGLFISLGSPQEFDVENIRFIGNKAPFKGNLWEVGDGCVIKMKDVFIEYGEKGNGNFLFLNDRNVLIGISIQIINVYDSEVFFFCNNQNSLELRNLLVEDNKWTNCFIFANFGNKLKVQEADLRSINISESGNGFLNIIEQNSVKLSNLKLNNFQSRSRMILTAASLNEVYCDKLKVFDIKTFEGGTSFKVETLNSILITDSIYQNIFGYSCESYLVEVKNNNTFIFRNLSMYGYFSVEQVIKAAPSIIKLTDQSNNISFLTSMIAMNNSNSLGNEIFTFLNVLGFDNRIFISKTLINISNFLSFLTLDHWGVLSIENSNFKNCIINGELFSLRNSQIFFLNVSFKNIKLKSKNALISISRKTQAQLKRVTCNNDVTFLISSGSSYSIVSSIFINKFPASSPKHLIINSNGSKAYMQAVEIIMKKNINDSVIISIQSNLVFKRCNFIFNKGHFGGLIKLEDHSNLTLLDNKFLGNEADYGGALYFDNSNGLKITGNTFLLNKAVQNKSVVSEVKGGKGGCFYSSYDEKDVLLNLDLTNNSFRYNGAKAGGIFFVEGALLSQSLSSENISDFNIFQKNKGEDYGNMYASTVKDVHMVQGSDLNSAGKAKINIGTKIKISSPFPDCLVQILTVDHFNQVTLDENYFKAKQLIYNSTHVLSFSVKNSFLCFEGVSIYSQSSIEFIKEGSTNFNFNASDLLPQLNITINKTFELNFTIKTCQMGDYFDFLLMKCLPCQANFFSFNKNFLEPSSCKSCTDEPFFCYGGFNHTPKPRYWRNSYYSTNFLECPIPEACIGDPEISNIDNQLSIFYEEYDNSIPNGVCGYGYRGVLCNTCEIGFAKTNGRKCSECSGALSIFLMTLKILVRIMMYYYTAYKALKMMQRVREGEMLPNLVYSNFFLKIFMIYCQFLKTMMNFRFNYPSYLKEAFSYFSFSISSGADKVMNLECLFDSFNFPLIYIYSLINVFAPLFVVFTLLVFLKSEKRMRQAVIITHKTSIYCLCLEELKILPYLFMIMLMMAYEETFGLFLSGFSVVNIETDEWLDYRLVKDFEIDFYSASHQIWAWVIALPFSILIGIFTPIFILIRIYFAKKQNKLKDENFLLKYGYFFYAYDNKHSFYEMCFFLRKVFLVIVELFFFKQFGLSKSNEAQTFSVITCFFYTGTAFYIFLHQPFKRGIYPVLNKMEKMLAHVQAITAWIICFLMTTTDIQASLSLQIFIIICFIVTGFINIAAIIVWLYYYWKICLRSKLVTMIGNLKKTKSKNSLLPSELNFGLKRTKNVEHEKELNSEECDMIEQNTYRENKVLIELPFQHSKTNPLVFPASSTLTQSDHRAKRNPFYIINKKPNQTNDDFKSFNILLSKTHRSPQSNQFSKIFSEFNCKVKNESKLLYERNGMTPSIKISIVVAVDSDLGKLSLLFNESDFVLKCKQCEYVKPKRELLILLEVFFSHQTQLSNLLEFAVFDLEKQKTQFKLQVEIFITDFFQKETSYILNDEVSTDLTSQGIPYPSRAILHQLVCKPLNFLIQNVQTKESTYLRELSLEIHSPRDFDSNLKRCVFLE